MSTINPFGAAFESDDPRRQPALGVRRFRPEPGSLDIALEVAIAMAVALSAAAVALGLFLPPPEDSDTVVSVDPEWCFWAGWVGLGVATPAAMGLAAVTRSWSAWVVVAVCAVTVGMSGVASALFR